MAERVTKSPEPKLTVVPQALMTHALDTFGCLEKAQSWLATPNPALNNEEPAKLARTAEGGQRVEEVLTRIDYGIFS
jgi:putative toxin-antitoxin system antitoxin component (TIGR02293 family)